MSKMNQVIQIGEIEGNIHYYIEDYAYTFLKKQESSDRKKYFLYGEREEIKEQTKLYIYGIAQKPKMEQTYFKEYYPLGFLKIKEDGNYWISLSGQEHLIKGIYVFYAPNQAMQEYLVDFHKEEKKEEKPPENIKKRFPTEMLPMKEMEISARRLRDGKRKKPEKETSSLFPAGGIIIAFLLVVVLTSTNGRNKLELFKRVIQETMSQSVSTISEEEFIIEEKKVGQTQSQEEGGEMDIDVEEVNNEPDTNVNMESYEETASAVKEENNKETGVDAQGQRNEEADTNAKEESNGGQDIEVKEKTKENAEEISVETEYEEYIVQNGDTLVGICKKRYNSLLKMDEICKINNIKNADYIAPGQKLYLPR